MASKDSAPNPGNSAMGDVAALTEHGVYLTGHSKKPKWVSAGW